MMHIIFGLFFIALGIWGVFDEWYYVIDFVKGSSSVVLVALGIFGIFAGVAGAKTPAQDDESGALESTQVETMDEDD